MKVYTSSVRCIITVCLDITLGAVGLDRSNKDKKTHLRLQTPSKHIIRDTAQQMETADKKKASQKVRVSDERAEEYARLRRKERGRRVYPENFVDTQDYKPDPREKIHDDLWIRDEVDRFT